MEEPKRGVTVGVSMLTQKDTSARAPKPRHPGPGTLAQAPSPRCPRGTLAPLTVLWWVKNVIKMEIKGERKWREEEGSG